MKEVHRHGKLFRGRREVTHDGSGIVSRSAGRSVGARDFRPVHVGHKPIVVFQPQRHQVKRAGIGRGAWDAQPSRGVDPFHLRRDVAANQRAVSRAPGETERAHFGDLQITAHAHVEVLNLNPLAFKRAGGVKIRRDAVDPAGAGIRVVRPNVRAPHRGSRTSGVVRVDAHTVIAQLLGTTTVVAIEKVQTCEGGGLGQTDLVGEGRSEGEVLRNGAQVAISQVFLWQPGGGGARRQDRRTLRPVGGIGAKLGDLEIARTLVGPSLHLDPAARKRAVRVEARRHQVAAAFAGVGMVRTNVRAPNHRADRVPRVGMERHGVVAQPFGAAGIIAVEDFDVLELELAAQVHDEKEIRHRRVVMGEGVQVPVGEVFFRQSGVGLVHRDHGPPLGDIDQVQGGDGRRVIANRVRHVEPPAVIEWLVATQPKRAHRGLARGAGNQEPRARTGAEQSCPDHPLPEPVRDILALRRERRSKFAGNGLVGTDQREIIAGAGELEVDVEVARRIRRAIARSKHDEKRTWGEHAAGENPPGRIQRVIRETPTREVSRRIAGVVEFDPIRRVPVAIQQRVLVAGHEFGEAEVVRGRGGENEKHQGGKASNQVPQRARERAVAGDKTRRQGKRNT